MELAFAAGLTFCAVPILAGLFIAGRESGKRAAMNRLEESLRTRWIRRGCSDSQNVSLVFGGYKITGTVSRT